MLTFFNNTAEDLGHTIQNLQDVSLTEENYLMQAAFNIMKNYWLSLTDMEYVECLGPLQPFAGYPLEDIYIPFLHKWCRFTSPNLYV
jgi:hypothetical protein